MYVITLLMSVTSTEFMYLKVNSCLSERRTCTIEYGPRLDFACIKRPGETKRQGVSLTPPDTVAYIFMRSQQTYNTPWGERGMCQTFLFTST